MFGVVLASALLSGNPTVSAQDREVREVPLPIDSLLSSDIVIAKAGPRVITIREFVLTSLFGPAFVKRGPDTRQRTLEYMINEKLLGLGARSTDPRVTSNLEALEGDLATEELYRDDILKQVHVRESEIRTAIRLKTTDLSVRWLYRKDRADAALISRRLKQGTPFDSVYAMEFADTSVMADDRRMKSDLFSLRLKNAPMAALAENLAPGQASDPVEAPDGFYILRVDSVSHRVLLSQVEQEQIRSDAWRALTKAKADSLSDSYVRKAILRRDPVIQRPVFDLLRAWIASQEVRGERFAAFGLPGNVDAKYDYRAIDRYAREKLITMKSGTIPLGEFLAWYRLREANMRFRTESPKAFFLSVEDAVWRMVRDRILVRTALTRGLQHRPTVVSEKRWWKEKLLYQVAKDSIMRTIDWSDSTLHAYYDSHPRSFRDSTGSVSPFETVKEHVLREWYDIELKKRTYRRLSEMKKVHHVTINQDVLSSIPIDAENDPRAIDVYTVKKGGTFPHPAFPSIDYSWQSWQ